MTNSPEDNLGSSLEIDIESVEFGVTYETAFQLLHKIRNVMADHYGPALPTLEEAPEVQQVGWSLIPTRLPWLQKPSHHVGLIAIELENGWHYSTWRDARATAIVHRTRASTAFEARLPAVHRAGGTARYLRLLHRGVSLRWLDRYLAERRALEEGLDGDLLRGCLLWAGPRAWRHVPPALPPLVLPQRRRSTAAANGGSATIRSAPCSS